MRAITSEVMRSITCAPEVMRLMTSEVMEVITLPGLDVIAVLPTDSTQTG